jgi:hypothetical protein
MAVPVSELITLLDRYTGDNTTERITEAERLSALTEACVWLNEELGNDHGLLTYELDFFDTINYYKVTDTLAYLLTSADLRQVNGKNTVNATHKDAREMSVEIANGSTEFAWGVERKDGDTYLAITFNDCEYAKGIGTFDGAALDGGEWVADETNSDATSVTFDTYNKEYGSASLAFSVDVSQSANDRATIYNEGISAVDLTKYENVGAFLLEVYLPDVTDVTSITLFWGDDSSNYWTAVATSDIHGNDFVVGNNTIRIDWNGASKVGDPSTTATYFRIDVNYENTQVDMNGLRLDYLRVVRPTKLVYYYNSWIVGYNTSGTALSTFSATDDVPYYSGRFDQYRYAHAQKAASILLYAPLRRFDDAQAAEFQAGKSLTRYKNLVPKSRSPEMRNFKVHGVNFRKRKAR